MNENMMMTLDQAAQAVSASRFGPDRGFVGVTTDSRALRVGELFVALSGERFDGHAFVAEVLARGAAGALVSHEFASRETETHPEWPLLAVDDTRRSLGALAAAWRRRFALPLIGITGSNGKTTVKEMSAAILRAAGFDVLATTGNLNNDIGLPLTLLGLRDRHSAAVIEMGMNHPGEIAYLTQLAQPSVAVVNNAQRAHLEGLGSVQDVALAKGEIFAGLDRDGIAVFNADDPQAALWHELADGHIELTFGLDHPADVRGEYIARGLGGELRLTTPWGDMTLNLAVPGRHNARNACAAAAATLAAGAPLAAVVAGLTDFRGVAGRLTLRPGRHGARIVDDSYNANPDSLRAAIDVLAAQPGRRILVLGDMGETGPAAGQFHDEIGGYAKSHGIDRLFCLGELSLASAHNFGEGGQHFDHIDDLVRQLEPELDAHTTVLVKGSRFMRMERVIKAIGETDEVALSSQGESHAA